jgi:membrane protein DedA with SNARE-associated domain
MPIIPQEVLSNLLQTYGCWSVGGIVALESMGLPVPGETTLIAVAVLAGSTHSLNIGALVAAAAAGAILGDNAGFWIGREAGFRLLVRYGRYIRVNERKIKLGQYLFLRHGGKLVFFGRFVAILRALAALLAGINCMSWPRFLAFNAAGGVIWASIYGFGGWYFGQRFSRLAGPAAITFGLAALAGLLIGFFYLRHHVAQLELRAEATAWTDSGHS